MTIEGGCRCGASRYKLALDAPPAVYCCHCLYCQTWSGSAFTMQGLISPAAIEATGPIVDYAAERPSGGVSTQHVCSVCHTRLWNTNSVWPAMAIVRAGTLDDSHTLRPRAHIWVSRKQPWVVLDPAMPAFEENPTPAEFIGMMR